MHLIKRGCFNCPLALRLTLKIFYMQHLPLALAIILLTIVAGVRNRDAETRKPSIAIQKETRDEKKPVPSFPVDRIFIFSSRFDMIVN